MNNCTNLIPNPKKYGVYLKLIIHRDDKNLYKNVLKNIKFPLFFTLNIYFEYLREETQVKIAVFLCRISP